MYHTVKEILMTQSYYLLCPLCQTHFYLRFRKKFVLLLFSFFRTFFLKHKYSFMESLFALAKGIFILKVNKSVLFILFLYHFTSTPATERHYI